MSKAAPIPKNHKRQWLRCRECSCVAYYDYVPFSLSNPISWMPCNHGVGQKDMGADRITAAEASVSLSSQDRA